MDIPPPQNKTQNTEQGVGPLAGIIIIVALMAAGGIYFFFMQVQNHAAATPVNQTPANS